MCLWCVNWTNTSTSRLLVPPAKRRTFQGTLDFGTTNGRVGRRYFFHLVASVAAFGTAAEAQIPGAQHINLGGAPDGGPLIPEFIVMAPGKLGGFMGFATIYQNVPVIFYDPGWVSKVGGLQSPGFRFIRAHEYGHHRSNHAMQQIMAFPPGNPMIGYVQELEADCWAVWALRNLGDIAAINAGLQLYSMLPPGDFGGKPGSQARVANIHRCAQ